MYGIQPVGYLTHPQEPAFSANNTTKKIQNYTFKLNEVLGKGNFSKVYRGLNQLTNEPVAIKVVELSSIKTPALVDLLYSEIEIVKALNHPNILRCYEVFSSSNNCYIITELCDGDLETRIRKKGAMSEREGSKVIYEVFQGLKYLAEQNIVHRDFKIANILLAKGIVKIADFGFAKRTRERWKDINIGSPIYMSPEAFIDNIYGPKTDVWAFGVFMYEILHGDTPLGFCHSQPELRMHIRVPLRVEALNPRLSYELKDLILRCLDVDQRRRISIQQIEQMPFIRRISAQFGPQTRNPQEEGNQLRVPLHQQQQQQIMMNRPLTPNAYMHPPESGRTRHLEPQMQRNQHQMSTSPAGGESRKAPVQDFSPLYAKNKSFENLHQQFYETNKQAQLSPPPPPPPPPPPQQPQPHPPPPLSPREDIQPVQPIVSKFKVMNPSCVLTFQQCVNLLHYCRLVYKSVIQMTKIQKVVSPQPKDFLTNWLFDVFKEIEAKIHTHVKFEGQKAAQREEKLEEVINEYHKKYFKEIAMPPYQQTSFKSLQSTLKSVMRFIDETLQGDLPERRELIIGLHYLMYLYETNAQLQKCALAGDYAAFLKKCTIENFLSTKRDNYNQASYQALRPKIQALS